MLLCFDKVNALLMSIVNFLFKSSAPYIEKEKSCSRVCIRKSLISLNRDVEMFLQMDNFFEIPFEIPLLQKELSITSQLSILEKA